MRPSTRRAPARQKLSEGIERKHGGAAFARCASGIDCGTCSSQMWSRRLTEIDVTSPGTQLLGIDGHVPSVAPRHGFAQKVARHNVREEP